MCGDLSKQRTESQGYRPATEPRPKHGESRPVCFAAFEGLVANDDVFESARPIFRGKGIFDADGNRETIIEGKVYEAAAKTIAAATGDRSVAELVSGNNVGNAVILTQALDEYASREGNTDFEFNSDYRAPLMVYMAETRTSGRDLDSIIDLHADADYANLRRDFQGVALPDNHQDVDAICGAIYDIINDDRVSSFTSIDDFAELVQSNPDTFKRVVAQRIDPKALGDDKSFDQVVEAFRSENEGQDGRAVMDNMMDYYQQFHSIRGAFDELGLSDTLSQLTNDQADYAARAQARVDATKPTSKPVQGTKPKQGKRSQGAGSAYSHGASGGNPRPRRKR